MSTISILDEIIGKIKNTKTVIKKLQEDKKQLQEIIKNVIIKNNTNQIMNDSTNIYSFTVNYTRQYTNCYFTTSYNGEPITNNNSNNYYWIVNNSVNFIFDSNDLFLNNSTNWINIGENRVIIRIQPYIQSLIIVGDLTQIIIKGYNFMSSSNLMINNRYIKVAGITTTPDNHQIIVNVEKINNRYYVRDNNDTNVEVDQNNIHINVWNDSMVSNSQSIYLTTSTMDPSM